MLKRAEFYALLTQTLGPSVDITTDYIPTGATFPAVSYFHLSQINAEKLIEGRSDIRQDSWQVEVIAKTRDECDQLINLLAVLDGASSNDFQNIQILNQRDDPAELNTTYRRSFIDIQTTNRSY